EKATEPAVDVDAHHLEINACVVAPDATRVAFAAGKHGFDDDPLAQPCRGIRTSLDDLADQFVADHPRITDHRRRTQVSREVGAADPALNQSHSYEAWRQRSHF